VGSNYGLGSGVCVKSVFLFCKVLSLCRDSAARGQDEISRCGGWDIGGFLANPDGMGNIVLLALGLAASCAAACATFTSRDEPPALEESARAMVIARSQVWTPVNVKAMDVKAGPGGPGAFPFRATVVCDYVDKQLPGQSPKFVCKIGERDEVKVKYGADNGEVYGEVLATRLLWALGFGADRIYPVNVICRGCPLTLGGIERPGNQSRFDPAVIEREMQGKEWPRDGKRGWSWSELDASPRTEGAPRAHRDALKLLAVFLQHTDSKREQQRILCRELASDSEGGCPRPFLMISDVGLTFGRANFSNANDIAGANLAAWRKSPVWKTPTGCTGHLPKSFNGTLDDPVISESGRQFLADLLVQLSDQQIRNLFEVARVELRLRSPRDPASGWSTVEEWIRAFKEKREQIVSRRCA
jgi:hypothetical protein